MSDWTQYQDATVIMQAISEFLCKNGATLNSSFRDRFNELLFNTGMVPYACPVDDVDDNLIKVRLDGNYIVIEFVYVSMMVGNDLLEEFLAEQWRLSRLGFTIASDKKYPELRRELEYIIDQGYGVRIATYAGIGGSSHKIYATLFTPEDLQERF